MYYERLNSIIRAKQIEISHMAKSKNPLRFFEYRNAANELHRNPRKGPAQRLFRREDKYTVRWTDTYAINGAVVARSEHRLIEDEEGRLYREKWFDAQGDKHRDRGPAVIKEDEHYIREETYLDEAIHEFWKHGKKVAERDMTYRDIISHKPLAVRRAFGYDW
jgi:hypothetical protein